MALEHYLKNVQYSVISVHDSDHSVIHAVLESGTEGD